MIQLTQQRNKGFVSIFVDYYYSNVTSIAVNMTIDDTWDRFPKSMEILEDMIVGKIVNMKGYARQIIHVL